MFDEEFPEGEALPAAPASYQTAPFQTTPNQAAPQQATPAQAGSSYAVAVPTVGPIENSEPEPSSMGGGGAILIGVGLSGGGALVWAVVAIVTGYQIGWIAWGVGFCSGVGMAIAHNLSDAIDDFLGGVIASIMAILGIVAGKAAVYQFVVLAMLSDLAKWAS